MKESVKLAAKAMTGINDLALKGEIVVFGSTYMAKFPLYELINKYHFENAVYNRSIEGLTVQEASELVQDCVISIAPAKIFIALGEADEYDADAIKKYKEIVKNIRSSLPKSKIYLISLKETGVYAQKFNENMRSLCDDKTVKYIQLVSPSLGETAIYKAQFKQLSCFFRNGRVTMADAFAIEN